MNKLLDEFPEEKERVEKFTQIVNKIDEINTLALDLCEYPEFNALIMAVKDMEDSFRLRINSMAKTMDARHLINVHQILETLEH